MEFMNSYKHLEKICGEIFNDKRCVSAYIDEMIKNPNGSFYVEGWNSDLKQLKHWSKIPCNQRLTYQYPSLQTKMQDKHGTKQNRNKKPSCQTLVAQFLHQLCYT